MKSPFIPTALLIAIVWLVFGIAFWPHLPANGHFASVGEAFGWVTSLFTGLIFATLYALLAEIRKRGKYIAEAQKKSSEVQALASLASIALCAWEKSIERMHNSSAVAGSEERKKLQAECAANHDQVEEVRKKLEGSLG